MRVFGDVVLGAPIAEEGVTGQEDDQWFDIEAILMAAFFLSSLAAGGVEATRRQIGRASCRERV